MISGTVAPGPVSARGRGFSCGAPALVAVNAFIQTFLKLSSPDSLAHTKSVNTLPLLGDRNEVRHRYPLDSRTHLYIRLDSWFAFLARASICFLVTLGASPTFDWGTKTCQRKPSPSLALYGGQLTVCCIRWAILKIASNRMAALLATNWPIAADVIQKETDRPRNFKHLGGFPRLVA